MYGAIAKGVYVKANVIEVHSVLGVTQVKQTAQSPLYGLTLVADSKLSSN